MAATINGDGLITLDGTSTTQGRLRLAEDTDNGTNYVELQAPASVASNVTFTLPSADGTSGQVIQTNGSGALSFVSPASLATPLAVTGNATAGAEIRLPEDTDNGSNYVALKAADSIASNVTFTLPAADGTSGQVLQTNGSGTLSFATPSSGAMVWLATATASNSASLTLTSTNITSTYDTYMIVLTDILLTNAVYKLQLEWSADNGSTYVSDYRYVNWWATGGNASGYSNQNTEATKIRFGRGDAGVDTGDRHNYTIYVVNPSSSTHYPTIYWNGGAYGVTDAQTFCVNGAAFGKTTGSINNLKFTASTGNITSGSIKLYGLKNS